MQSPLDITFHPLELSEHGRTPSGRPLYRIVWADSRVSKLSHEGKLYEFGRYEEQPLAEGKWILEKWLPAEKYIGMTRERYEQFLRSMPGAATEEYPVDGEYELAHIFPGSVDEVAVIEAIRKTEYQARHMTQGERKQDLLGRQEAHKEAVREAKAELLDEIVGRDSPKEEVNRAYAIN